METASKRPAGMTAFLIIWLGQIVSVLASGMSQFALTIFLYQKTNSATALGMMQVFYITPFLLISPFAGVMVDRYNRKWMMMISDLVAGLATLGILVVLYFDVWQLWHMYLASVVFGLGNAFQWPAYSAAITTMVSKEQLGRANGLMSLMEAGPGVLAPLLAGMLLPLIHLTGILFFDVATFLIAIGALLAVHVPQPPRTQEGIQAEGGMLKQAAYGFKYIFARPSLLGLQLIFFAGNLFSGIGYTVFAPMILARSGNDSLMLGAVQSAGAIASVAGGVLISAWGGFKRRVYGVLLGWCMSGLGMAVIGFAGGLPVWVIGVAVSSLVGPLVNASNQALWQAKVAPDLQGRVFSARRLIAWFTNPISPIIGGALADFWLEPAARSGLGLPAAFAWLVGTGAGAGMGLLIVFCGIATALVGMTGYFIPSILHAETLLPDHDGLPAAESA